MAEYKPVPDPLPIISQRKRIAAVRLIPAENEQVPSVQLAGFWLTEAGFAVGTHVQVSVKEERLVITKMRGGKLFRRAQINRKKQKLAAKRAAT